MKRDRTLTLAAIIFGLIAVIEIITGNIVFGLAMAIATGVVILIRGTGKFNERSRYEKVVKANDISISDIYELLKDTDTPFGKPWLGGHTGYYGDSIIFGPNKFRDMVVISHDERHKEISLKHINKISNIIRQEEDEWRFDCIIDTKTLEVNPANFSEFTASKVSACAMLIHLTELIEKLVAGENPDKPETLNQYKLHYYNSKEGYFVDADGEEYLTAVQTYTPFKAAIYDLDDEEVMRVEPRQFNREKRVVDKAGYDMYFDGEHFAEITRQSTGRKRDEFIIKAKDYEFVARNFPNTDRANVLYNYIITLNDRPVAITAGNHQLQFEGLGMTENDVIMSLDEDFQNVYNAFWIFVMTLNKIYIPSNGKR